jgi:hypothetical protein
VDRPTPKAREVLISVRATTVSTSDVRIRSFAVSPWQWLFARLYLGLMRPRNAILGMEIAGEIEALGTEVTRFKVGDRVFGATMWSGFGGYGEYDCMPEDTVLGHVPQHVSFEQAAPVAGGGLTAQLVLEKANIQRPACHRVCYQVRMLSRSLAAAAVFCVAMSVGCGPIIDAVFGEPVADVDHPKAFARAGLAFSYPGNWTVQAEEETIEGIALTTMSVESPGAAILTMVQYQPGTEFGPGYAEEFLAGLELEIKSTVGGAMEVKGLGVVDAERTLLGQKIVGKQKRLMITVIGEKVPHTQGAFVIDLEDRTVVIYSQVADEDIKKAQPGFDQVLDSLKVSE